MEAIKRGRERQPENVSGQVESGAVPKKPNKKFLSHIYPDWPQRPNIHETIKASWEPIVDKSHNSHHRRPRTATGIHPPTTDGGLEHAGAAETTFHRHHPHMAQTSAPTLRIALGDGSLCPVAAPSFHNTSVRATTALVNVTHLKPNHWTPWKTTCPWSTTSRRRRPRIRHPTSPGLFLRDLNRLSTPCTS